MAEENELPKDDDIKIDTNIATWEMRMEGTISGTYVGVFRFRCYLTPLQQIAAGKEQRELLGNNAALATEHESFLAYALTQLKQRIISAPPFWASASPNKSIEGDLPDEDVIEAVLDAAIRAELKYKRQLKERKEAGIARANEAIKALQEKKQAELNEEADQESSDKS